MANLTTDTDYSQFVQGSLFGIMGVSGIIGNLVVITIAFRVMNNARAHQTVCIYLITLSTVDLVFSVDSLMNSSYILLRGWKLGAVMCKLHFGMEGLNKTWSPILLAMTSFDRYVAVCHPSKNHFRDPNTAIKLVLVTLTLVVLINIPIYIYTEITAYDDGALGCNLNLPTTIIPFNLTGQLHVPLWLQSQIYYISSLAILFFMVPSILIIFFYLSLLLALGSQERRLQSGTTARNTKSDRKARVTKSIIPLIVFYFACWTPFWLFTLLGSFGLFNEFAENHIDAMRYIANTVFFLPPINSAINPILYGILNKSLRHSYRESVKKRNQQRMRKALFGQMFGAMVMTAAQQKEQQERTPTTSTKLLRKDYGEPNGIEVDQQYTDEDDKNAIRRVAETKLSFPRLRYQSIGLKSIRRPSSTTSSMTSVAAMQQQQPRSKQRSKSKSYLSEMAQKQAANKTQRRSTAGDLKLSRIFRQKFSAVGIGHQAPSEKNSNFEDRTITIDNN